MLFLNRIGPGPNELSINIQTGHKIYIFIPFINTTNVLNAGDDLFLVSVFTLGQLFVDLSGQKERMIVLHVKRNSS